MAKCAHVGCLSEATCELEATGLVNQIVGLCEPCRVRIFARHQRMRDDADEMRARGVSPKMVSRIMCARVDRGYYL